MSENYIGEIRTFAFGRIPYGWIPCDGALLQIRAYQALYSLIGKQYGGDGVTTFAVPDLRGRTIKSTSMIPGANYNQGDYGGSESVVLNNDQVNHNHAMYVDNELGDTLIPTNFLSIPDVKSLSSETINIYNNETNPTNKLNSSTIEIVGEGAAHNNYQPFIVINFCIATIGMYPQRPY